VHSFFNSRSGIYRYLSILLVPQEDGGYGLQPHNVAGDPAVAAFHGEHLSAYAARVIHGTVSALAWRIEIGGKSIVFSGDTNGEGENLVRLATMPIYLLLTTQFRKGLPALSDGYTCLLQ
jgi:L-ascorbate metabolism protein UlaG (beta-lactamase superfamily)